MLEVFGQFFSKVTKIENFPKWLFILNVTHESMCYFGFATIDLLVFIHCSLRLGLVYESVASAISVKSGARKSSETFGTFFSDDQVPLSSSESNEATHMEKYSASPDAKENLLNAK